MAASSAAASATPKSATLAEDRRPRTPIAMSSKRIAGVARSSGRSHGKAGAKSRLRGPRRPPEAAEAVEATEAADAASAATSVSTKRDSAWWLQSGERRSDGSERQGEQGRQDGDLLTGGDVGCRPGETGHRRRFEACPAEHQRHTGHRGAEAPATSDQERPGRKGSSTDEEEMNEARRHRLRLLGRDGIACGRAARRSTPNRPATPKPITASNKPAAAASSARGSRPSSSRPTAAAPITPPPEWGLAKY